MVLPGNDQYSQSTNGGVFPYLSELTKQRKWWFSFAKQNGSRIPEDLFVTGRKTESGGRIQAIQSGKLWFSLDQREAKDPVLTVLPTMASEHDSPIWILHVVFLVYGYTISIHEWYVISWKNQTCEITHYHLLSSIAIYYHLLPLSHVEPFLVEQSPHTDLSLLLSFQNLQQQSHPFDVCDTDHAFLFMANLGSALHTVENLNLLYNYILILENVGYAIPAFAAEEKPVA